MSIPAENLMRIQLEIEKSLYSYPYLFIVISNLIEDNVLRQNN